MAFVNTLLRAGCRVPDEVSVVSYGDTPIARYRIVQLTSARYPVEEIATQSVGLLCSRMDGSYRGSPRQIAIQGGLSVRESTHHLIVDGQSPSKDFGV